MFLADQCQLRHFDAAGFEACMTGRRLFLIGALPINLIQICCLAPLAVVKTMFANVHLHFCFPCYSFASSHVIPSDQDRGIELYINIIGSMLFS